MQSSRYTNHLGLETSPYLLQHAHNPVDWYPWGKEAFLKAKNENKPIFLSVGYSTCYWCHVMERKSFEDTEIAKILNDNFVSIKVDREERPDVDGIYMKAVQAVSGQGGWPMSVLLTPELKPFFGGTYFPKQRFILLLNNVKNAWLNQHKEILQDADRITSLIQSMNELPEMATSTIPSADIVTAAANQFKNQYDAENGGFGDAPKFPQPARLELLMTEYETNKQPEILAIVNVTLDHMARGGIYDQVGGGFHRYSTDKKWVIPHFEKMLYDNAQLLHSYVRAFELTGNVEYKRIADEIVQYVKRDMTSSDGLFYSAQNAEVEHEEGKSYRWTIKELQTVLTSQEYSLIENVYGLKNTPNFEGYYLLYWPELYIETAKLNHLDVNQLFEKLNSINTKLLVIRQKRIQPSLDDKSITAWNGLMVEAMAYAGKQLDNPAYIQIAKKAADQLLKSLRNKEGTLLHVTRNEKSKLDAYLDDYAATILGLLALADASQQNAFLDDAALLADQMIEKLWNPRGNFYYASANVTNLITRQQSPYDGAMPSGISLAVRALVKLVNVGYPRFDPYVENIYKTYTPLLSQSSVGFPYMLWGFSAYQPDSAHINNSTILLKSDTKVKMSAVLDTDALVLNKVTGLTVTLSIANGWHINSHKVTIDVLIPTSVTVKLVHGKLKLNVDYPKATDFKPGENEEIISVYNGEVAIRSNLTLMESGTKNIDTLTVSVEVQACNDNGRCLLPSVMTVDIPVRLQ